QSLRKLAQGQAGLGAAVSAIFCRDAGAAVQFEERLELTDDFAAGSLGIKALPKHTPEGAPASIVAVSAVLFFLGLGKQCGRHPEAEAVFQLAEGVGTRPAQGAGGARTHGSQGGPQSGQERSVSVHVHDYYWTKG